MTRNLIPIGLVFLVLGCSHLPAASDLSLEQIGKRAAELNGKRISTSGILVASELSGLYLYSNRKNANEENYTPGIDVILDSRLKKLPLHVDSEGECASVMGEFTAFNDELIGMGYYRSQIGYMTADEVRAEKCN